MGRVVIGMDPHKRSATIEVIDEHDNSCDVTLSKFLDSLGQFGEPAEIERLGLVLRAT